MARPSREQVRNRQRIEKLQALNDILLEHYLAVLSNTPPGEADAKLLGECRRMLEATGSLEGIVNEQRQVVAEETQASRGANPALTSLIDGVLADVDTYYQSRDIAVTNLLKGELDDQ